MYISAISIPSQSLVILQNCIPLGSVRSRDHSVAAYLGLRKVDVYYYCMGYSKYALFLTEGKNDKEEFRNLTMI